MKPKCISSSITGCLLMLAFILASHELEAAIRREVLETTRPVKEKDWLKLNLTVLGLQLSYPAYRIHLELDDQNYLVFQFLASSGLADHLTERSEREDAEQLMNYHARGIQDQVERLLKDEFPSLWSGYNARADFTGTFMGPGENWDEPPRSIGVWKEGQFHWRFDH